MATQGGGPAILDMARHLVLFDTEPVVGLILSEILPEDVCHLGPLFSCAPLGRRFWIIHDALPVAREGS